MVKYITVKLFHHIFSEEGEVGLKHWLHYIIGRDDIPPLGIPQKIEVVFYTGDQPSFFAETCLFQLKVPVVHEVLKDFKAAFMEACSNNKGFGSS